MRSFMSDSVSTERLHMTEHVGAAAPVSRRTVLRGAAAAAGAVALGAGSASLAYAADSSITATSLDGSTTITLATVGGALRWSAARNGTPVIESGALGLKLSDGTVLGSNVTITEFQHWHVDDSWSPTFGRNASVTEAYQEMRWNLRDVSTLINFSVIIRAYAEGVAFRYALLDSGTATIASELTTFAFPTGTLVYSARDEDEYNAVAPGSIPTTGTSTTDNGPLTDIPLTATLASGLIACVCESSRLHYPRLMLSSVSGETNTLAAYLMQHTARGTGTVQTTSTVTTPFTTPWRVVVIGSTHAQLIDNAELVQTLAAPLALADTSWIKPGKAFRCALTTAAGMAGVDFAVARGLQYIEYDSGWYGPESTTTSATTPISAIDLPSVIAYAKSKGVGVILYINRIVLSDPESLFALYQSWGVAGVKLGFIDDGTQAMTDTITGWVQTAAAHKLVVDAHDDVRPFGYERTYPNWITIEGVRGNEHFPTATHNVTLPFARNIGGPMDYTICYAQSRDQTTNAHQMAMAAVYYQPLNFLYWYDVPSKYATPADWPGLPWFDAVPTTWDESKTLAGAIGQYVVIARRSGTTWYLGAMTNESARTLSVPLSFLGTGSYTATIYADGTPATSAYATPVTVGSKTVGASTTLAMTLAPSGGQAVILRPS
jgi:alpha-glucosidase